MRLRILLEPRHGADYHAFLALALAAERLGFDAFFRSDHLLGVDPEDPHTVPSDAWTTLAGLARDTRRIRLGTLLTAATFRSPGLLAVIAATVDTMSGGRVELGLGTGWYEREHRAFGIPFPATGARFDRLEEQLAIVTGLWSTPAGQRFSFEGSHYRIEDCPAPPRPCRSPRPPLIVGGAGTRPPASRSSAYRGHGASTSRRGPSTAPAGIRHSRSGIVSSSSSASARDAASTRALARRKTSSATAAGQSAGRCWIGRWGSARTIWSHSVNRLSLTASSSTSDAPRPSANADQRSRKAVWPADRVARSQVSCTMREMSVAGSAVERNTLM
ncbi:LLM class flavin-dependent oxidoreductase [Streptomyces antnestii]|uniref:LLM class flavin-dependent oxidoreductase n=1 Tax=Streptomyces antnestii TaxID=2494256 RepID=A0A3S2VE98_9ACTN|nr:LLM class flavin-dependent oxidoreductase [Streptomyces sp. San01]